MCLVGLAALSLWLILERWIFDWHDGHRLLSDVIKDASRGLLRARPIAWSTSTVQRGVALSRRLFEIVVSATRSIKPSRFVSSLQASASSDTEAQFDMIELTQVTPGMQRRFTADSSASTVDIPPLELKGVERFKYIVNGIIIANRIRRVDGSVTTQPSPEAFERATRRMTEVSDVAPTVPSAMVNALVPRLKNLTVTTNLDAYNALVKDLQFSPDGKFLATARSVIRLLTDVDTLIPVLQLG